MSQTASYPTVNKVSIAVAKMHVAKLSAAQIEHYVNETAWDIVINRPLDQSLSADQQVAGWEQEYRYCRPHVKLAFERDISEFGVEYYGLVHDPSKTGGQCEESHMDRVYSALTAINIKVLSRSGDSIEEKRMTVVENVFTPPRFRRQGAARLLLKGFYDQQTTRTDGPQTIGLVLSSSIGIDVYGKSGYRFPPASPANTTVIWKPPPGHSGTVYEEDSNCEPNRLTWRDLEQALPVIHQQIRNEVASRSVDTHTIVIAPLPSEKVLERKLFRDRESSPAGPEINGCRLHPSTATASSVWEDDTFIVWKKRSKADDKREEFRIMLCQNLNHRTNERLPLALNIFIQSAAELDPDWESVWSMRGSAATILPSWINDYGADTITHTEERNPFGTKFIDPTMSLKEVMGGWFITGT